MGGNRVWGRHMAEWEMGNHLPAITGQLNNVSYATGTHWRQSTTHRTETETEILYNYIFLVGKMNPNGKMIRNICEWDVHQHTGVKYAMLFGGKNEPKMNVKNMKYILWHFYILGKRHSPEYGNCFLNFHVIISVMHKMLCVSRMQRNIFSFHAENMVHYLSLCVFGFVFCLWRTI